MFVSLLCSPLSKDPAASINPTLPKISVTAGNVDHQYPTLKKGEVKKKKKKKKKIDKRENQNKTGYSL